MNTKLPILLIEDNEGDAHLIELSLQDSAVKHHFFHAESFFEGSEMLKNKDIGLVLLDLSLPDSNGFKTLTSYLEKFSKIPVIVLTGINNEIIGNQAVKAGAQDFLVKGQFDNKLLGRSIRYSLQRFKTQVKLEETARNLAVSEKRYVEAQEMAHFGSWEMDMVTNVMKWTDEIYRIFGFLPNSLSPSLSDYINYVHIEDRTKVEDFFENAGKDGKLHQLEHRIIIDGRNIKFVAIQAKVYFDNLTEKLLLVGAIQDITERKLGEKLIVEKNITNKASKIQEQAIADISFHIRTPLSSIFNLLYLLEQTPISSQQVEYIDGLKTSVDDLSIMVTNLLNFNVLVAENISVISEEIQIKEFLMGIKKVIEIKTDNSNVALDFDIDQEFPLKIKSDPQKITQILYNLIDYTIKQHQGEGKLKIHASSKPVSNDNYLLCLDVINIGKDLPTVTVEELQQAENLLEVYSEDLEENNKSILGMAIVNKLIKVLSGKIQIENKSNQTQFSVEIPVNPVRQASIGLDDIPDTPLNILLVEDHFLNQIATKKVLTTWSDFVTVDIAENGQLGVQMFEENEYDLVLMDIQMPVLNGMEASIKIRKSSNVPIIALTANASKQEADRCLEIGINEYLAKPFKPQELKNKILSLLVAV